MPYKDPKKQREAQRKWAAEKYANDPDFREREAERKKRWLNTLEGSRSNQLATKRHRRRKRREEED